MIEFFSIINFNKDKKRLQMLYPFAFLKWEKNLKFMKSNLKKLIFNCILNKLLIEIKGKKRT